MMFAELDENRTKYQIKAYGLSNSSLEQVFLRVANEIKRSEDYQRLSWWQNWCQHWQGHVAPNNNSQETKANMNDQHDTFDANIKGNRMNMICMCHRS
jgi:hypothetical protein